MTKKLNPAVLKIAVEQSNDGIIITDNTEDDNPIVYVNPAFEKLTGYTAEDIIGHNCRFLQGDYIEQSGTDIIRNALNNGESCRVEIKNQRKDGSTFWNELSISPVKDNNGDITYFIGVQKDITERKAHENRLKHLSEHDELTKIFNRRGLFHAANAFLALSKRTDIHIIAVMADIDKLKSINDKYGHHAGDMAIKATADILRKAFRRETDIIGRIGGDEFVILTTNGEAVSILDRVILVNHLVEEYNSQNTHQWQLSISAGHVKYDQEKHNSFDHLLAETDAAMYKVKKEKILKQ